MANSLPRLYLDTTIPSAYYNDRQRERQLVTKRIWHEKLPNYHLVISNITIKELGATKNRKRRRKLAELVRRIALCPQTPAGKELANEYLKFLNIPKYDAFHIANATVFGCEILLSWNFAHMVTLATQKKINDINLSHGCKPLMIISPHQL
jgi:predicted nucleic acid-binding protein